MTESVSSTLLPWCADECWYLDAQWFLSLSKADWCQEQTCSVQLKECFKTLTQDLQLKGFLYPYTVLLVRRGLQIINTQPTWFITCSYLVLKFPAVFPLILKGVVKRQDTCVLFVQRRSTSGVDLESSSIKLFGENNFNICVELISNSPAHIRWATNSV